MSQRAQNNFFESKSVTGWGGLERQEAGSEPWDRFGLPQDEAVWEMEETKQEILFPGWGKGGPERTPMGLKRWLSGKTIGSYFISPGFGSQHAYGSSQSSVTSWGIHLPLPSSVDAAGLWRADTYRDNTHTQKIII